MMKKIYLLLFAAMFAVCLSGCIGSAPIEGMKSPIMAEWKAPLNTNLKDVSFGTKVGRASVRSYAFGLFSSGDMSLKTAAQNGNITTVRHVDYEYRNVFFFSYQEMTTVAYGD